MIECSINECRKGAIVVACGLVVLAGCGVSKVETATEVVAAEAEVEIEHSLTVDVELDGGWVIDGAAVSEAEARTALTALANDHESPAVVIRGNGELNASYLVGLIRLCRECGIENLAFATNAPADE